MWTGRCRWLFGYVQNKRETTVVMENVQKLWGQELFPWSSLMQLRELGCPLCIHGFVSKIVNYCMRWKLQAGGVHNSVARHKAVRWRPYDHFRSLNKVHSCSFISSIVDWTTSWYFLSGSWGQSTRANGQGNFPSTPKSIIIQSYIGPSDW